MLEKILQSRPRMLTRDLFSVANLVLLLLLLLLMAKHRLGRSLFLLRNRFLALVLPNLNRSG